MDLQGKELSSPAAPMARPEGRAPGGGRLRSPRLCALQTFRTRWTRSSTASRPSAIMTAPASCRPRKRGCRARRCGGRRGSRRLRSRCAQVGAACNVIDRPAYCHFQFGSIVNRSPVVVGISTSGAAPILGQAIRRRIETPPPALAEWAALARAMRGCVKERLAPECGGVGSGEKLAERAFGPLGLGGSRTERGRWRPPQARAGKVTSLSSALDPPRGTSDAQSCARASRRRCHPLRRPRLRDDVLELARREAKRILVGKRVGLSGRQHEINEMIVGLARADVTSSG